MGITQLFNAYEEGGNEMGQKVKGQGISYGHTIKV